uniref:NADH dehydrogenase subunit 5 n=1 Tax=Chimarra sadayu TaxID=1555000 RepID=UPI00243513D4|nr:NADH dehydrogenase subunit 5 [Chimarra sadayu]WEU80044.1 NADH dehydrogenase subunit 5 [Chimarra sadayu]
MNIYICLIYFFYLLSGSIFFFLMGSNLIMLDYSYMMEWEISLVNSSGLVFLMLVDWMSMLFMSLVLLISGMVVLYSWSYMGGDFNLMRFIYLVLLFVMSMMFLIISPNLISILLGWDGLGLVSFCLVVYYQNSKSFNSGMLTVLSNRIGDVMILMSIVWGLNYGSWNLLNYMELFKLDYELQLIGLLLIFSSMTKSAQIPFSSWLPAAMAAPTPVSALVHSSTLVTAGVYLMIRFNDLIVSSSLSKVLLIMACLTMFMSGMVANYEFDLKKIIALSTLSQLGVMMGTLGLGLKYLAFFHLLTHALFKSMLFMCAGLVIHSMKGIQDIRLMGNLVYFMPLVCMNLNVGNLALCGFPFMSGFYSKDLILEMCLMSNLNMVIWMLFFVSTSLTVSYSVRLVYFSMVNLVNLNSIYMYSDNDNLMNTSIISMVIFSVMGGGMISWLIMKNKDFIYLIKEFQYLIIFILLIGVMLGLLSCKMVVMYKKMNIFYYLSFMSNMWNLVYLSTNWSVGLFMSKINYFKKLSDFGFYEYIGGQGLAQIVMNLNKLNFAFNINLMKNYLITFIVWFIFIWLMI